MLSELQTTHAEAGGATPLDHGRFRALSTELGWQMNKLQDILDQLDRIMSQRATNDEAIDLIVKALHAIASDHHALKSKVGEAPFSPSRVHEGFKGGVS